jgi:hypothetical protein
MILKERAQNSKTTKIRPFIHKAAVVQISRTKFLVSLSLAVHFSAILS